MKNIINTAGKKIIKDCASSLDNETICDILEIYLKELIKRMGKDTSEINCLMRGPDNNQLYEISINKREDIIPFNRS